MFSGMRVFMLVGRRESEEELNIDYRYFEPKICDKVRFTFIDIGDCEAHFKFALS